MLISIDHGNKQIKTNHRTFVSGLRESDTRPPFGKDVLFYKGKYYTLTDQRIPYMRDKTADERYFILTLFAVAFELAEKVIDKLLRLFLYDTDHAFVKIGRCILQNGIDIRLVQEDVKIRIDLGFDPVVKSNDAVIQ